MERLPFSYDRVDRRPEFYEHRDWDYEPRVKTTRDIQPYVCEIACRCANELADKAKDNILRIFHFNMMSRRDHENEDFDKLIQFVCDLIELRMATREIHRPDKDLDTSIVGGVLQHCVSQVDKYQDLYDAVKDERDRRFENLVLANLGKFRNTVEDIDELHGEDQRDLRSSSRDHRDRQDYRDRPANRERDRRERREERGRDRDRSSRREVTSGRDRDNERNDHDSGHRTERGSRRDREDRRGRESNQSGREAAAEVSSDEVEFFMAEPASWSDRPSQEAQAAKAREEHEQQKQVEKLVNDRKLSTKVTGVLPVFQAFFGEIPILTPTKETEMDMLKHAAAYGRASIPTVDMSKEAARFLTLAQAASTGNGDGSKFQNEVIVSEAISTHDSITEMVRTISDTAVEEIIASSGGNTDGVRKVYHAQVIVSNRFTGFRSLKDFHLALKEKTGLADVATLFKQAVQAVNSTASAESAYGTDIRAAVERYNRVLTREINAYCRAVLRVSDGNAISSFMLDFQELYRTMNDSEAVSEDAMKAFVCFLAKLMGNIRTSFSGNPDLYTLIKTENDLDESVYGMSLLPLTFVVTHLPFTMNELGYEINNHVAIVGNEVSPFLTACLDLSNTALSEERAINEGNPDRFRMIVTRDLRVFRYYTYPDRPQVLILDPIEVI